MQMKNKKKNKKKRRRRRIKAEEEGGGGKGRGGEEGNLSLIIRTCFTLHPTNLLGNLKLSCPSLNIKDIYQNIVYLIVILFCNY